MRGTSVRRPRHVAGKAAAAALLSVLAAGCIGLGAASANNGLEAAGAFGVNAATTQATAQNRAEFDQVSDSAASGEASLATPASRDISGGLAALDREQREADEAKAAAEAAAAAEAQARQEAAVATIVAEGATSNGDGSYTLNGSTVNPSAVDWSMGEQAFVSEWTGRINNYLAGSPLAGYGEMFAQAAWDFGVDPRWSPAISNTESSKGASTFAPYNAWGWGSSGWSSWEEAIRAHVAGLAAGYGSSLTVQAAQKYCPPNADVWYANTAAEMNRM